MRKLMYHNLSYVPEYRVWQTMRARCVSEQHASYKDYGGRGITVCERWMNSPETFIADMGPRPSKNHQIDRIDNDLGYFPSNCRWVTPRENARNRRSSVFIEFRGETRLLVEWSEITGIDSALLASRIRRGVAAEVALTTPPRFISKKGESKSAHICIDCGKSTSGVRCLACYKRNPNKKPSGLPKGVYISKVFGEKCKVSKLSENQVLAIRAEVGTYAAIGKRFGIDASTVFAIKKRKTWKHLPEKLDGAQP